LGSFAFEQLDSNLLIRSYSFYKVRESFSDLNISPGFTAGQVGKTAVLVES